MTKRATFVIRRPSGLFKVIRLGATGEDHLTLTTDVILFRKFKSMHRNRQTYRRTSNGTLSAPTTKALVKNRRKTDDSATSDTEEMPVGVQTENKTCRQT
jgi:hypothetical protein